jgi:hypothetical protein
VQKAAIEANSGVVSIRIGTSLADPIDDPPVNRLGPDEWIQLIPGDLIADTVRRILDKALDAAVVPPPPPDASMPWLPKPKPQELRKDGAARATWVPGSAPAALGQGDIIAVDACPLLDVDISIELSLRVGFEFPDPDTMKTTAVLTWDADSTWCDVLATVLLGVPFGIGFHVGAEAGVSDAVLGKSLAPGDGFDEIARTDRSITFQRVAWGERLLGVIGGQRSAALQLVTDANETLGIRCNEPFSAPAPTLSRSWMFPFSAQPLEAEPVTIASAGGLLGLTGRDGVTRILDPRDLRERGRGDRRAARGADPRDGRVTDALAREAARGRNALNDEERSQNDPIQSL